MRDTAVVRLAWILVGLAACGRIGFDRENPATDASGTDAPLGEFSGVRELAELSSLEPLFSPTLTSDELEILFRADPIPMNNARVFVARRATRSDSWSAPFQLPVFNAEQYDINPALALDGLSAWWSAGPSSGQIMVYTATRPDRATEWAAPATQVAAINGFDAQDDLAGEPDAGALRMIVTRGNTSSNAVRDLSEWVRSDAAAPWTQERDLVELNTARAEDHPQLTADGLRMYLSADRAGNAGGRDLYVTERAALGATFGPLIPLAALNTPANEYSPWVSPDGRRIYFSSDRGGMARLYQATAP